MNPDKNPRVTLYNFEFETSSGFWDISITLTIFPKTQIYPRQHKLLFSPRISLVSQSKSQELCI